MYNVTTNTERQTKHSSLLKTSKWCTSSYLDTIQQKYDGKSNNLLESIAT